MDIESEFWFCVHPGCPNWIIRHFDPRIVNQDHADHTDMKNFTSFNDSHKKLLAMVESGKLSPPYLLEQAVGKLADDFNKKVAVHLGTLKDAILKYSMNIHPEKFNM
jgi:hypothetical protein